MSATLVETIAAPAGASVWTQYPTLYEIKHLGLAIRTKREIQENVNFSSVQLGFDFCYDKKLYDRLEHGDAENIRLHLCADPPYLTKLLRFIENHDEARAAATFSSAKQKAPVLTIWYGPPTMNGISAGYEVREYGQNVSFSGSL
jgi:hypothetical protein